MLGSEEDDDRELPPSRGVGASLKIAIPSDAHPGDRLTITTPSNQTVPAPIRKPTAEQRNTRRGNSV